MAVVIEMMDFITAVGQLNYLVTGVSNKIVENTHTGQQ